MMTDFSKRHGPTMIRPMLRYAVVGVASNAAGYGAYLFLTCLGVKYKVAMTGLYLLGVCIGFLGNRNWSFEHHGNVFSTAWRFGLAHFAGYFLNLGLLTIFVDNLGYPHQWVQAAAIFVVGGFLFLAFKLFVFRSDQSIGKQA